MSGSVASLGFPPLPSGRGGLVFGWRVPVTLGSEQDGCIRTFGNGIGRRCEFPDEFDVGLLVAVEIDRLLAFGVFEPETHPPQPRIFRLGVSDDLVVTLARDMIEHEE